MVRFIKRKLVGVILLVVVLVLISTFAAKNIPVLSKLTENSRGYFTGLVPEESEETSFNVLRVVDGDTFVIMYGGEERKVRLIGVDTPESVHEDESKNCPEGKTASSFTKSLLEGKEVMLEFDKEEEDKYGRLLAYVRIRGEKETIQEKLLKMGYARTMEVAPNTSRKAEFKALEAEARKGQVGFWGEEYSCWREN